MEAGYILALTTGLLGGFGHCIGMCGPLIAGPVLHAAALAGPERKCATSPLAPQVLYHAGRILTYGIVGAAMGLAGSFMNVAGKLAGLQNTVMVLAGLLMLVMGLGILGVISGTRRLERHNSFVLLAARRFLDSPSPLRYFPLGIVLGLLPCGLSYTAFIAAAGTGAPGAGFFTMLFFGAGTLPALALFGIILSYFGSRVRGLVQKAGGAAVIVMGIFYLVKGIQLYVEM